MRFDSIKIRNLGPFRSAELQLAALTGTLIAITGANGAGKSTLLELLAAALYRQCPTRGPLAGLATARDAGVEVSCANGQAWELRHTVDAVSGKGSSVVLGVNGPAYDTDKVRDFDRWSAAHLPPPEVLYASSFSPQGSGGFLELETGDRKAVLLRVLGIEHLEQLAERARERARDAKGRHQTALAREHDERARGMSVADADAALVSAQAEIGFLWSIVAGHRTRLAELEATAGDATARHRARLAAEARRAEAAQRVATTTTRIGELAARIRNNRAILTDADAIRAAVARSVALRELLAAPRLEAADLARTKAAMTAASDARQRRGSDVERAAFDADRIEAEKPTRTEVELAVRHTTEIASTIESTNARIATHEATKAELEMELLGGAEQRIGALRSVLSDISTDPDLDDPASAASIALIDDDTAAARGASAPERLRSVTADLARERRMLVDRTRELHTAEAHAARLPDVEAREQRVVELRARAKRLGEELHDLCEAEVATGHAWAAAEEAAKVASDIRASQERELAALDRMARLGDKLAAAEARLAELEPQHADASAEARRASEDLAAAEGELKELAGAAPVDIEAPTRALREAETALRSAEARVAVREAALADARATEAKVAALSQERVAIETELADWERLAQDLGRDGIQALEIDAAGPELTEMVNDLLHTCHGTRWTVSIEATRTSADGKRQLEGCEVRVLDTERGRDAAAKTLSGGERVIVGEAISLALSMLACRRAGVTDATLVRDESGAALDATNARAYVAMLRRAAQLIGAHQVLLVSHAIEVQELCDTRVLVADGTITVQP